MSDASADSLRLALVQGVRELQREGLGIPTTLEATVRDYARSQREAGVAVERVIIEVKAMVLAEARHRELVLVPRLVGWTVAGYFAGTARRDEA